MSVFILNLNGELPGVSEAFRNSKPEIVDARETPEPVEDICQLIKSCQTDNIVVVTELKSDNGNARKAPDAIRQIRRTAKTRPNYTHLVFCGSARDHKAAYRAKANAALPLDVDPETKAVSIDPDLLHQHARGAFVPIHKAQRPKENFKACGDLLTRNENGRFDFLGEDLGLTKGESTLLRTLMSRSGMHTRESLYNAVVAFDTEISLRMVDSYIKRIRKKMHEILDRHRKCGKISDRTVGVKDILITHYGDGYSFNWQNVEKLSPPSEKPIALPSSKEPMLLPAKIEQSDVAVQLRRRLTSNAPSQGALITKNFCGLTWGPSGDFTLFNIPLTLNPAQTQFLGFFLHEAASGKIRSRQDIRDAIYHPGSDVSDNTIGHHISTLNCQVIDSLHAAGHTFKLPIVESILGKGWRLSVSNLRQLGKILAPESIGSESGAASSLLSDPANVFSSYGFSIHRPSRNIWFRNEGLNMPSYLGEIWFRLLQAGGKVLLRDQLQNLCHMEGLPAKTVTTYIAKMTKRLTSELNRLDYHPDFPLVRTGEEGGWAADIDNLARLEDLPRRSIEPAKLYRHSENQSRLAS